MAPKIALVSGANGITGAYVVKALAQTKPSEWSKIYTISRSPPHSLPDDDRVEFIQADLNVQSDSIADFMRKGNVTGVTHYFHYAYIHSNDNQVLVDKNVPLFRETLMAVEEICGDTLERVVLQTGAKHYGIHFGPAKGYPITESLGRRTDGPPNFYYPQEDILFERSKAAKWSWNIVRPWIINGVTKGNGMSFATTAFLYLACEKARGGTNATFSGSEALYKCKQHMSSSTAIADFTLFIATNPEAANEDFNIVDGDDTTNQEVWEYMANLFGLTPIVHKDEMFYRNYAKEHEKDWVKAMSRQTGGSLDPAKVWEWSTWEFNDQMLMRDNPNDVSIEKARKFGWTKTYDTKAELKNIFNEMQQLGVIPK